jgi:coiled-coil domain-containing protein 12
MSSRSTLTAAAEDRKAKLAHLRNLKRKQPSTSNNEDTLPDAPQEDIIRQRSASPSNGTTKYFSGRNYDAETRGPKLGFDTAPAADEETIEKRAAVISAEAKAQAELEEKNDTPLDLFKLQPKKPNWDLKRELNKKLEILNQRTDNAIARLVRERIEVQKREKIEAAKKSGNFKTDRAQDGDEEAEEVGMEGQAFVEAMHLREKEEEEEARREREDDEAV